MKKPVNARVLDEFTTRKWRARIKARRGKSLTSANVRELNLVAMMDMMTVVLVFLLKSYSVSAMSIPVGDEIQIPKSTNTVIPAEAVKLTITKTDGRTGVMALDEAEIMKLDSKKMAQLESQARARNFFLRELGTALKKKADTMKMVAKISPQLKFEGKIMIIADKDTPYWLVTQILYTAAESEFEQYNLVAMKTVQD